MDRRAHAPGRVSYLLAAFYNIANRHNGLDWRAEMLIDRYRYLGKAAQHLNGKTARAILHFRWMCAAFECLLWHDERLSFAGSSIRTGSCNKGFREPACMRDY
jgi:hypothetical protein